MQKTPQQGPASGRKSGEKACLEGALGGEEGREEASRGGQNGKRVPFQVEKRSPVPWRAGRRYGGDAHPPTGDLCLLFPPPSCPVPLATALPTMVPPQALPHWKVHHQGKHPALTLDASPFSSIPVHCQVRLGLLVKLLFSRPTQHSPTLSPEVLASAVSPLDYPVPSSLSPWTNPSSPRQPPFFHFCPPAATVI